MTSSLFLILFILFIAFILILDMKVIDKDAHEVSIKEASIWTFVWIGLSLLFAIFLFYHGDLVHNIQNIGDLQRIVNEYAPSLQINTDDYTGSLQTYRKYMTISYISGYLIEKTLSVDNLFVMMMIFTSFGVSKKEYQHVLNWGILGAIVLRFIFIFAGAAIISTFEWILVIFGFILLYNGWKMLFGKENNEHIEVSNNPFVKFLSKHFNVYPSFVGDNFFTRCSKGENDELTISDKGKWFITPLLLTVVVIETSDLVFAFDSIPAIFSVSRDPYVVFFSNIFAILGLRSMFFLLSAIVDKFRFLKTGVAILLLFIGFKLLLSEWFEMDAVISLIFIMVILFGSILLSIIIPVDKDNKIKAIN